ncbi:MAG: ABC transporter permease [Chitinophagales bacterium]|nr:ABC transporter permease [Chitinophagales bacterium]MDW8427025.1 ABC transporter permease subunit [Chitinophagales bacterium]
MTLIRIELSKVFSRPRSYIGFVVIAVIGAILLTGLSIDGQQYIQLLLQQLEHYVVIRGKIINGSLGAWIVLQTLIVHMPLLTALVAGDLISGEAASGTLRLLATRPPSRRAIVHSKFIAAACYSAALVGWLGIVAWGGGWLLMGSGDLLVLSTDRLIILPAHDLWWRFALALVLATLALTTVSALALWFSVMAENSVGPIVATISVVVLFTIIGTMEFPLFQRISPVLFTTHMAVWRELFYPELEFKRIVISVAVLLGHIAVFIALATYLFSRKDILT